jgi:hypothetical protein
MFQRVVFVQPSNRPTVNLALSTLVERALQIRPLFMQNKPNLGEDQMNISFYLTRNYEQRTMNNELKKQTQSNPTCSELACPACPERSRRARPACPERIRREQSRRERSRRGRTYFKTVSISLSPFCFSLFFAPAIIWQCRPGQYKSS